MLLQCAGGWGHGFAALRAPAWTAQPPAGLNGHVLLGKECSCGTRGVQAHLRLAPEGPPLRQAPAPRLRLQAGSLAH